MSARASAANHFAVPFLLTAIAMAAAPPALAAAPAPPQVGAWFAKYCGDCHAGGSKEGGVSLEGVKAFTDAKPDVWSAVYEQVQLALMPPADAERPSAEERAAILDWLAGSMRAAGHHVPDKLALPNYGNYVPHEPLFRGPAHPGPATPVRAWRLRPEVYESRVPGIQPFAIQPGQQVSDFASLYEVDESAAEVVLSNAQAVVERLLKEQYPALLDPKQDPVAGPLDAAVDKVCDKALGRPPSAEERADIRTLYDDTLAKHGRDRAVKAALTLPFVLPDAYYRLEIGVGEPDAHGRRRLAKEGIVRAIQQTLFGNERPPRLQALLADEQATLGTQAEVAAVVHELLDAEKPGGVNARVLKFFEDYFDYTKAKIAFREVPQPLARSFMAGDLVDGMAMLITKVVAEDRDVLRRLLTTREAFVTCGFSKKHGTFRSDNAVYNLPPDSKVNGLASLDPTTRCGILTQPAWLVAYGNNFDSDPVRRGKWILEHLLGGTVPDVPVTVCAVVPTDPTKTLRERFSMVSDDAYCWKCHYRMNQLGMPFEAYDHYGRFRFKELDRPVDTSGAVVDSGVPELDGPVATAVELIERIAKSRRAEEMFVRYAFRFFLGRNETLRDAKTLREAHETYVKSQGSMKAVVSSLLSSDSFLYRFDVEPVPASTPATSSSGSGPG